MILDESLDNILKEHFRNYFFDGPGLFFYSGKWQPINLMFRPMIHIYKSNMLTKDPYEE